MDLTPEQNARLEADLQKRLQGDFSMAGIQFWSEMRGLPEELLQKADSFKQVVAVFTNVIFDTTQLHANRVFPDMFAWLDTLLEVFKAHPETFFVLRAHPDEARLARPAASPWQCGSSRKLPRFPMYSSSLRRSASVHMNLSGCPNSC